MKANDKIHIFVYGSLLTGMYNYDAKAQKKIKDVKTKPLYELFTAYGSYPMILKGKQSIIGEIHEINLDTFASIHRMEIGANYQAHDIELEDGSTCLGYLYNDSSEETKKRLKHIPNGDWRTYKTVVTDALT